MGRTAESYLQESSTKPLDTYYTFAEWTDMDIMSETQHELEYRNAMRHSPARLGQIERKIAHLIFEVQYRNGMWDEKA